MGGECKWLLTISKCSGEVMAFELSLKDKYVTWPGREGEKDIPVKENNLAKKCHSPWLVRAKVGRSLCWWGIAGNEAEKNNWGQKLPDLLMTRVHLLPDLCIAGSHWNGDSTFQNSSNSCRKDKLKEKGTGSKESALGGWSMVQALLTGFEKALQ